MTTIADIHARRDAVRQRYDSLQSRADGVKQQLEARRDARAMLLADGDPVPDRAAKDIASLADHHQALLDALAVLEPQMAAIERELAAAQRDEQLAAAVARVKEAEERAHAAIAARRDAITSLLAAVPALDADVGEAIAAGRSAVKQLQAIDPNASGWQLLEHETPQEANLMITIRQLGNPMAQFQSRIVG